MARPLFSSRQTITLLEALLLSPERWRYGYDISRETGLKAGTLYPLLMRLESRGWLETEWGLPSEGGKPRRHLYRLSARGIQDAKDFVMVERARDKTSLRMLPRREEGT